MSNTDGGSRKSATALRQALSTLGTCAGLLSAKTVFKRRLVNSAQMAVRWRTLAYDEGVSSSEPSAVPQVLGDGSFAKI
jgi:hypothetical protein